MKTIAAFLTSLSVAEKAISALFGALAVGVLLGAIGVREIPRNIAANTALIDTLRVDVRANTSAITAHADLSAHDGVEELRTEFLYMQCMMRLQLTGVTFTPLQLEDAIAASCPKVVRR